MDSLIAWMRQGLEAPGKSQRGLARALGLDPAAASRMLKGARAVKAHELAVIAEYLERPAPLPETAIGGGLRPALVEAPARAAMARDLPVYGAAVGGREGCFELNSATAVDYVRRPPGLADAPGVFALYVIGDSMAPRYEEGDLIFVHPGRPTPPGSYAVVELHGKDGEPGQCFVKRVVKRTTSDLVLEQFNPPRDDIRVPLALVRAVSRVLSAAELLGA